MSDELDAPLGSEENPMTVEEAEAAGVDTAKVESEAVSVDDAEVEDEGEVA